MKKIILPFLLILTGFVSYAQLNPVLSENGKYGFVDALGDTVVPAIYDEAQPFSEGLALVKKLKSYKLIDTTGRLWDKSLLGKISGLRYDWGEFHSGLPMLVPVWECAYIDFNGKKILEIPYRDAESFDNGKAKVYQGDKYNYINHYGMLIGRWQEVPDDYRAIKFKGYFGYVNKNGKLVIDYQFINARDFHDGVAKVSSDGKRWSLINKKGRTISETYEYIGDFEDGAALVRNLGNYGFIDKTGKFLGEWYTKAERYGKGLYKVEKYESFALVRGGMLVTKWFDQIERYSDLYILAKKEGKYAFLNNDGAYVVGWYDQLWTDDQDPYLVFVRNGNDYGFYNTENKFISPMYDTLMFADDIILAKYNDKYGFLDRWGNKITDYEFDFATVFDNGIATVEKAGKVAYINKKGDLVVGWVDKSALKKSPPPGLILVKYGNKYGFETLSGRRVIAAMYDYAEPFSDGLALVMRDPKPMYIDTLGNYKPLSAYPADKSLRLDWGYGHTGKPVVDTVWKVQFIDYEGNVVLDLKDFSRAESFRNGKAKVYKGDKYNYIDKTGKLLGQWKEVPQEYHAAEKGGKFGFIDRNNHTVIPYKFDAADDFKNGYAKVRIGNWRTGKWGYIDKKGNFVTDLYDNVSDIFDGRVIAEKNGQFALIDLHKHVLSQWYDKIGDFNNGMALVVKNGKYSFIDRNGKQIKLWFDKAYPFTEGRARVYLGGKWGFIDTKGNLVIKPQYDAAWDFEGGIAKVGKDGKFAFINKEGKQITGWYDRIYFFSDGMAVVMKDGKWGYIDYNGKLVIPLEYDRAFAFTDGKAMVIKDGKQIFIDKFGNIIEQEDKK